MPLSEYELNILNQFARDVWGKPGALQRFLAPPNVAFIDLGQYLDAFMVLFAGIVQHDKILVRDEYRTALEALQTEHYYGNGVYIVGQPGIGKSRYGKTYFLLYALVHLLSQEQVVAMQPLTGDPFYLLFKDRTAKLFRLDEPNPLRECQFVWAPCDSNQKINDPAALFLRDPPRVRIIQTTSPTAKRWKEWSKQIGAERYVMDIWSKEEVKNLATLLGKDVDRMVALADKWGAVPRTLLRRLDYKDSEVESEYRNAAKTAVKECETMMLARAALNLPSDPPSPFYFVRPDTLANGTINHHLPSICVPTQTLFDFLVEALQDENSVTKLNFYHALSTAAQSRSAAGFFYESWFHTTFVGEKISVQWITLGQGNDNILWPPPCLRIPTKVTPATRSAPGDVAPPYFWVAPINFPGVYSAVVLEDGIFAFQVIIAAKHSDPMKGMKELRQLFGSDLRQLPQRVVFVGPEQEPVQKVAERWTGKLRRKSVLVGWSVADRVRGSVAFDQVYDTSDPELETEVEE